MDSEYYVVVAELYLE